MATSADGVLESIADHRVVRAGGTDLSEGGVSPAAAEGTTPHERYSPETAERLVSHIEAALAGECRTFDREDNGEQYRVQTVPVRIDGGEITHAMAVAQNITEQAERRRALERHNEQLNEFASIVNHDLRNPLTVAGGYIELAQETGEDTHLTRASDAIERSQALIDELLTLAKEGDAVAEVEPVSISAVAEECWQNVATKTVPVEIDVTRSIRADRSRLQQLFENLYRNAVEHGGEDVTVTVGETADGFYVADTGPGIPESGRTQAFEAGYSTSADGTGSVCESSSRWSRLTAGRSASPKARPAAPGLRSPASSSSTSSIRQTGLKIPDDVRCGIRTEGACQSLNHTE